MREAGVQSRAPAAAAEQAATAGRASILGNSGQGQARMQKKFHSARLPQAKQRPRVYAFRVLWERDCPERRLLEKAADHRASVGSLGESPLQAVIDLEALSDELLVFEPLEETEEARIDSKVHAVWLLNSAIKTLAELIVLAVSLSGRVWILKCARAGSFAARHGRAQQTVVEQRLWPRSSSAVSRSLYPLTAASPEPE